MDHLNYFHPYKGKKEDWEDSLTRALLILVKYVPMVQQMVLELIREKPLVGGCEPEYLVPQYTAGEFDVDREAIYDGVLSLGEEVTVIIEDKPEAGNVWREQLNPSRSSLEGTEIKPVGQPVCLTWSVIVERLNILVAREVLSYAERRLIEDFFEFIDASTRFGDLRPYKTFGMCKMRPGLLAKRCRSVLETLGNVMYHRGWMYYLECDKHAICRMIGLSANVESTSPKITVELHPGATVSQAISLLRDINVERLRECESSGWELAANCHFSDSRQQFFWGRTTLDIWKYIERWKDYENMDRQFKRSEMNFASLLKGYRNEGLLSDENLRELDGLLINSGRNVLRVIPGLSLYHHWPLADAVALDDRGVFSRVVNEKIEQMFSCWGQSMDSIMQPVKERE